MIAVYPPSVGDFPLSVGGNDGVGGITDEAQNILRSFSFPAINDTSDFVRFLLSNSGISPDTAKEVQIEPLPPTLAAKIKKKPKNA